MDWSDRIGRRIRLRDLHILLAVAQSGSMVKAAELLSISQPVVSKTLAELEAVLKVPLFDRGRHGAEPTMYGRALLRRGLAVFDELKQGVQEIGSLVDPSVGHVSIGAADPMVAGFVPAVIDKITRQHPDITFQVQVTESVLEQRRALQDRTVELIVGRLPPSLADDDLQVDFLFEEPILVAAAADSPWTRRRNLVLADLVEECWVLPRPDTFVGSLVTEAFRAEGLSLPKKAIVCGSTHMNSAMLATGRYLAIYPRSLLRLAAKRLSIAVVPVTLHVPRSSVGIVTLKRRTISPVARSFLETAATLARSLKLAA